jgi:Arc/MetJ-type ribon-helix-helix transcriptional regulator
MSNRKLQPRITLRLTQEDAEALARLRGREPGKTKTASDVLREALHLAAQIDGRNTRVSVLDRRDSEVAHAPGEE